TTILESGSRLDAQTRQELLESVREEADRLNRLVQNLLEMTRLESGALQLRREWHPVEEVIGAALSRVGKQLGDRRVDTSVPPDPPMPDPVVVLIEDEPQIRKFLRATLAGQGYRLFEATTGADGVVEVGSRQPDVVIVDLGLPDMDGLDVIRRVREWTDVPVIVLSARGQERDKVVALDAGADDYVSQPFGAI